jgi:hypothetical protein
VTIKTMSLGTALILGLSGCAMPGGVAFANDNYECPATLLENLNKKLEELCPTPTPTPQPIAISPTRLQPQL